MAVMRMMMVATIQAKMAGKNKLAGLLQPTIGC